MLLEKPYKSVDIKFVYKDFKREFIDFNIGEFQRTVSPCSNSLGFDTFFLFLICFSLPDTFHNCVNIWLICQQFVPLNRIIGLVRFTFLEKLRNIRVPQLRP